MVGYSLIFSACVLTPSFPILSFSKDGKSLICFAGYIPNNNTCKFDASCIATSTCFVCPSGFYLNNGTCLTCLLSDGCESCSQSSSNNCLQCKNGYFLSNGTCFPCRSECKKCTNEFFCLLPDRGFYISIDFSNNPTGILSNCSFPCKTCNNNAN